MRLSLKEILPSILITMLVLIVMEIVSTAFLPLLGLTSYRLPFNILIILFLGFKLETPFLAILILCVQYFHSFFSVEGWAIGTIAGILVCISISYVRELIHFSSSLVTMIVTQIFQIVWFLIISLFIYIQTKNFDYISSRFIRFIFESITCSLMAPLFFSFLDKIWKIKEDGAIREGS